MRERDHNCHALALARLIAHCDCIVSPFIMSKRPMAFADTGEHAARTANVNCE